MVTYVKFSLKDNTYMVGAKRVDTLSQPLELAKNLQKTYLKTSLVL